MYWCRNTLQNLWERNRMSVILYDSLRSNRGNGVYTELCTVEAWKEIVKRKIGVWRLKRVRRNNEQVIFPPYIAMRKCKRKKIVERQEVYEYECTTGTCN